MSDYLLPERKARIDEVVSRRTRTLTVVIEALCDPQNVNAVLRTCDAFGVQDVHVVEGPMKGFDRNKKISQNADKWLDVTRWSSTRECLGALRERGYAIHVSWLGEGSVGLAELDFSGPVALVFGNESSGLPPPFYERYRDDLLTIPMPGVHARSHNLANAVSIVLYEALRQVRWAPR